MKIMLFAVATVVNTTNKKFHSRLLAAGSVCIRQILFALCALFVLGLSACAAKPTPALSTATVNAAHASMRAKNSATSRTVKVMEPGDHVEVLDQQDRWYKVRFGDMEGWMEISTLVTDEMRKQIQTTIDSA